MSADSNSTSSEKDKIAEEKKEADKKVLTKKEEVLNAIVEENTIEINSDKALSVSSAGNASPE